MTGGHTTRALFFRIVPAGGANQKVERWKKIEDTSENRDKYNAVEYTDSFYGDDNGGDHKAVIYNGDLQDEGILTVNANDDDQVPVGGDYIKFKNITVGDYGLIDRNGLRTWVANSQTHPANRDPIAPIDLQVITGNEIPSYTVANKMGLPFEVTENAVKEPHKYTVTIPEGVVEIVNSAFAYCRLMIGITIPETVTKISRAAFYTCFRLEEITIPETVTDIGEGAFFMCLDLKKINIPEGVTRIKQETFNQCMKLTEITIPESVTQIDYRAFYRCSGLTSVTIQEGVTHIWSEAFKNCSRLRSVTIPESVTHIGESAFQGCNGLEKVTLSQNTNIGVDSFPKKTIIERR